MAEGMYLGRDTAKDAPYHLESKRLRTHGIVVGMTGSGKTGMAVVALEELIREGVPIIAIDPKGDLANLGLVFPELDAASFAPWADGQDPDALATRWREGLARWGLDAGHVAALREKLDLTLYTPGSDAGVPVDVLATLKRPGAGVLADEEGRLSLVSDTVSGLLGLVGHQADPVRDPAHIVLATILDQAWVAGEDLDLEALILRLVDPPFEKVGVFPLERFFSADDRMDLAMKLNGVIASPSFAGWTRGAPLDLDGLLATGARTKVSVFSLSHLSESERAFFLSLLLGRLVAWTRQQPGTERLRAVLYFDEAAGWLPPHPKDPPSKRPLLTLMKQARAMGLGVVLATQNPVDLDYKAISNAGLWVIGKLRTKQDRERLLSGIPGEGLDTVVENLGKREFLVARASGDTAVVGSRHAMCFLRGPFTRAEIRRFTDAAGRPPEAAAPATAPSTPAATAPAPTVDDDLMASPPPLAGPRYFLDPRVVFSARMDGRFEPYAQPSRDDGALEHHPAVWARLSLRFDEDRVGFVVDEVRHLLLFPLGDRPPTTLTELRLDERDLLTEPPEGARFAALPHWLDEDKELRALGKRIVDDVYRTETEGMFVNKSLKLYGVGGESRADFDKRCEAAVADRLDDELADLEASFRKKADALAIRIRKAEDKVMELRDKASAMKTEEMLGIGETVLSWFSGRKRSLSAVASRRRRSSTAETKADQAESSLAELSDKSDDLREELEAKIADLRAEHEEMLAATEVKEVRLEKNDIRLEELGVVWIPVTRRL